MGISSLMKAAFPLGFIAMDPSSDKSTLPGNATSQKAMVPSGAVNAGNDSYTFYQGDGANGWPGMDKWVDFYSMWEANEKMMNVSCDALGYSGVPNPSRDELDGILDAISAESKESGLDERFLLAIMMQESKGCVRAKSTSSPGDLIRNPGLMQTHNGIGSCNEDGAMEDPCPDSEIKQMIHDGTSGTDHGDGLKQVHGNAQGDDAAKYYRASRMYNGGSVDPSGDLGKGCCTKCYASDIANRLMGWVVANHNCPLDGETGWSPMAHVNGNAGSKPDWSSPDAAPGSPAAPAAPAAPAYDDGMWHGNEGSWDSGKWSA